VTATLSGNSLSHFGTGLFVTQTTPTEGQPAGGQATVSGRPVHALADSQTLGRLVSPS
jgi:hypothetical protein